jgi:2-methylcitrate dehydratase
LRDGRVLEREQHDYEGFTTRPMSWDTVAAKFDRLADGRIASERATRIKDAVAHLEELSVEELTTLLSQTTR